jgi:hypothetical protein
MNRPVTIRRKQPRIGVFDDGVVHAQGLAAQPRENDENATRQTCQLGQGCIGQRVVDEVQSLVVALVESCYRDQHMFGVLIRDADLPADLLFGKVHFDHDYTPSERRRS